MSDGGGFAGMPLFDLFKMDRKFASIVIVRPFSMRTTRFEMDHVPAIGPVLVMVVAVCVRIAIGGPVSRFLSRRLATCKDRQPEQADGQ